MLWYNYLYENTMFTNLMRRSIMGKENDEKQKVE